MCHAGAFLHICHLSVSRVSMNLFLLLSWDFLIHEFSIFARLFFSSENIGLRLTIPIISAGSFGLSCDYKPKLTRILPPARKICDFFLNFMNETLPFKEEPWSRFYVYKKTNNASEDCFWWAKLKWLWIRSVVSFALQRKPAFWFVSLLCHRYINALTAATNKFMLGTNTETIHGEEGLKKMFQSPKRHSNSEYIYFCLFLRIYSFLIKQKNALVLWGFHCKLII